MIFFFIAYQTTDFYFLPGLEIFNVRVLLDKIKSGCVDTEVFIKTCSTRHCASALLHFLRGLDNGLLPLKTQKLIISPSANVSYTIIAFDVLGCLIDESRDKKNLNFIVVAKLLKLMKILSTKGSLKPTEHFSSQGPYFLMPILFDRNVNENF